MYWRQTICIITTVQNEYYKVKTPIIKLKHCGAEPGSCSQSLFGRLAMLVLLQGQIQGVVQAVLTPF
jgi:hypothetical protein